SFRVSISKFFNRAKLNPVNAPAQLVLHQFDIRLFKSLFVLELAEQLTVLSNIPRAAFMLVLVCWLLCIITRLISKLSTSLIIRWAWCVINVVRISLS